MEVEITEKIENPLLEREKIKFNAKHPNAPTPSRADVLEKLSSELGISKELIVIEKLATPHGHQTASGIARIYESRDILEELESKHLISRTEVSEEKREESEESEEETAPEEGEKPEEPEPEEEDIEKEAEAKEEKPEEEGEESEAKESEKEAEAEEEIDYKELSKQNISDIKEKAKELELDFQKLMNAEENNKNRATLKEWIENKIEE